MKPPFRWGIIGPGRISRSFATAMQVVDDGIVQAVASRDQGRAETFADEFAAPSAYDSYDALVQDPEVDIVYIGTCHPFHFDQCRLALEAGKPVLVEKPAVTHPSQLEMLLSLATEKNLFFMEGLWSRFFPFSHWMREQIASGVLGDIRLLQAHFCFQASPETKARLFDPTLGGGALLDVGIYTLAFLLDCLRGQEIRLVSASSRIGPTGIDEHSVLTLEAASGATGIGISSVTTDTPKTAVIYGTAGSLEIAEPFWAPDAGVLRKADGTVVRFHEACGGHGLKYEIQHVHHCLRKGLRESPIMSHADSRALQTIMWQVREEIGLRYPFDPA